jgi:hypothetical protein
MADLRRAPLLVDGDGIDVTGRLKVAKPGGGSYSTKAVTRDGLLVVSVSRERDDRHGLALVNAKSGDIDLISAPRPGGVFAADSDDRWVVWVQSTANDLFTMPWTMYSYDRVTKRTRQIAEAPDVGVDPVPVAPDGTAPSLDRGMVYFAAVGAMDGPNTVPYIYKVPVNGSRAMDPVVKNAFDPSAYKGELTYVRADRGSFQNWQIQTRDLDTGTEAALATGSSSRLSGIASTGGTTMWQVKDNATCAIFITTEDGEPYQLSSLSCGRGNGFAYFSRVTSAYAAFSIMSRRPMGYSGYLYSLADQTLYRLTDENLYQSTIGNGTTLCWTTVKDGFAFEHYVGKLTE